MDEFGGGRPNDQRNFIHKTIGKVIGTGLGIVGGVIGGPVGGIAQTIGRKLRGTPQQRVVAAIPGRINGNGDVFDSFQATRPRVSTALAAPAPTRSVECPPGFHKTSRGCEQKSPGIVGLAQRVIPGGATGFEGVEFGEAMVGRFGAGLEPAIRASHTRICPRGTVLGIDGLCYNKRDLTNRDRFWPKGRAPLLTGGEMRCITVASRAATKIRTKTKQLQKLGMLPKASRRAPARRQLPAAHHQHVAHD